MTRNVIQVPIKKERNKNTKQNRKSFKSYTVWLANMNNLLHQLPLNLLNVIGGVHDHFSYLTGRITNYGRALM